MKRKFDFRVHFLLLVTFALPLLLSACIKESEEEETIEYIKEQDRLPQFTVEINDGTSLSTADMLGRMSVIVFFSTSCNDCRHWLPVIDAFNANVALPNNIKVVCIAREEKRTAVEQFWTEQHFSVPYAAPESRDVYNLFANRGVPRVYVADEAGVVIRVYKDDSLPTEADLKQCILNRKK